MRIIGGRGPAAALVAILALGPAAYAATRCGVTMPETVRVEGRTLVLNGLGTRTATILKLDVYVIGLYLERRSSDAVEIIESKQRKRVVMHYVRDVPATRIREAWRSGLGKNYPQIEALQAAVETFLTTVVDMKQGEKVVIDLADDHITVSVREGEEATIGGAEFGEAVLSVWLGPKPPGARLKQDLLGR